MTTLQYFILDMLWHYEVYHHEKLIWEEERGFILKYWSRRPKKFLGLQLIWADLEFEFCVGQLISQPVFHFLSKEKWSTHQCIVEGLVSSVALFLTKIFVREMQIK